MKKYYFVYKTTNLINKKIYIGVHSTNKIEDGYIGCGIYRQSDAIQKSKKTRFYGFSKAVVRYGYFNFKRQILHFFKCKEDAYIFEAKIVNQSFIESPRTYNLKIGGKVAPSPIGIKRTLNFKNNQAKKILNHMQKLIDIHSKEFVVVDIKTNLTYHIKNLAKFAKTHNLKEDCLSNVARGVTQTYLHRWWVCYKKNWTGKVLLKKGELFNSPVILYNKLGQKITAKTLKEATQLTGADKSALSKVIRGKSFQTRGWAMVEWK